MKKLTIITLFLIFCSCSTKKDIYYIQDVKNQQLIKTNYNDRLIKIDDILKIDIFSPDPELITQFNLNSSVGNNANNLEMLQANGFNVDNRGMINFPIIGEIGLENLTVKEAEIRIFNKLLESEQLTNHSVKVTIVNSNVTVLGEVNNPGTFNYLENNMNIFKAIGLAGDLTINGDRKNIKLLRDIQEGDKIVNSFDITSSSILDSDLFHIKSGDIIIVNPNVNRVKNAGIIGNSGTLLSLLSFLLTSIILITNN